VREAVCALVSCSVSRSATSTSCGAP
jgi:hypothetical protein